MKQFENLEQNRINKNAIQKVGWVHQGMLKFKD